jgi:hypothetical protein
MATSPWDPFVILGVQFGSLGIAMIVAPTVPTEDAIASLASGSTYPGQAPGQATAARGPEMYHANSL